MTTSTSYSSADADADIAAAQRRLVEARAFRQEIDTLRGHARSRDGAVKVDVDATGLVLGLTLTDPLPAARELEAQVLSTIRAAQADVAAKAGTAARERFGENSPLVSRVDAELASRFAERDPDGTELTMSGTSFDHGGRWNR